MRRKIGTIAGLVLLGAAMTVAVIIRTKIGHIPEGEELTRISHHTASEIYSVDSVLLGRYFVENRTSITYEEIPQTFLNALIATEDARFLEHEGVDYRSLGRVLIKTILMGDRSAGGGSTLSQQLAKNLFPRKGNGLWDLAAAKVREGIVASRMEAIYSKEALLTLYLNTVSFGEDVYGLETAAIRYFSKRPIDLSVQESAVLVAMLKATNAYNPRLYPEDAMRRRNTVLSQMEKYGYLEPEAEDSLSQMPLELHYQRLTNERGTAPYFKERVRLMLDSMVASLKKPDGEPYKLNEDGLRITVPIHSRLQYFADSAVVQHMMQLQKLFYQHWSNARPWDENKSILEYAKTHSKDYEKLKQDEVEDEALEKALQIKQPRNIYTVDGPVDTTMSVMDSIRHYLMLLQAGFVAMEPHTGEIRAWVGGLDYAFFQYDHVRSTRQVGSTFKPIVYAAALEQGIKPCDFFPNERRTHEEYDDWSPGNSDDSYEGFYSLKGALTNSVNTVSAQVIIETGIERVIELAHQMGIQEELPEVPSLALGTADISLLQMVNAYATIANGGIRMDPVYVLKIENAEGELLWEHQPSEGEEVLSEESARLITNFMQSVVDQGTAASLRSQFALENDIAGKTGTTQSYADGWFIGFTPDLVAGVWVGADHPGVHFRSGEYGQGARMALPIWAVFMQQALNDPEFADWNTSEFAPLEGRLAKSVDCPLYTEKLTLFDKLFGVKDRDKSEDKKPFFNRLKDLFKKKD